MTETAVVAKYGRVIDCDLRLLIPPFSGPGPVIGAGITDAAGYIQKLPKATQEREEWQTAVHCLIGTNGGTNGG